MKNIIGALVILVAVTALSASAVIRSWGNGLIFISSMRTLDHQRKPAAIRKVYDYSFFEGEPLKIRSVKRLIDDAKVIEKDGSVGIDLGHFVTKGEDGRGTLACDFYDKVILQFEGEGILEAGEKPRMTLEAPCSTASDINRIETIWIPFTRLLGDHPTPARFLEATFAEQKGVRLMFDKMTSEWPRQWSLVSVRMLSKDVSGREISISKSEIAEILQQPLVIRF
jgi:hypothetical protein